MSHMFSSMYARRLLYIAACFLFWRTTIEQVSKCPTFCGLTGLIPDSDCKIFDIDKFNEKVFEKLEKLLAQTYFSYFKTVLYKPCKFWADNNQCMGYGCAVKPCDLDELPDSVRQWNHTDYRYVHSECESNDPLGKLDTEISESNETLALWENADPNLFCRISSDDDSSDSVYVQLQRNPERYTGYRGESAWKIWDAIYKEVLFLQDSNPTKYGSNVPCTHDLCLENRVFYNVISGLHASINVHLCANFYFPGTVLTEHWGYNLPEYTRRFGAVNTKGKGPEYLKNLYFLYLLEVRALVKASPLLRNMVFYSGSDAENEKTKMLVDDVLTLLESLPCSFNESTMFTGDEVKASNLKKLIAKKFENITDIMDCVGCDKCRMWGRLQTTALATAFNILFSTNNNDVFPVGFKLTRTEVVALFNSFGRAASSIRHIKKFRTLANEDYHSEL